MSLVVVAAISAQPHSAVLQQIESQWNLFDLNRSQQSANRCERFTSTDRHKDGVTFNGVQVGLGGFSDRPCQVGFVHNVFHDYDRLVLLSWSQSCRLTRCDSEGILTASHGQVTRKPSSFVLNWISTVPTSVMVPTRAPTCSESPIWKFTCLPPRLSRASPSWVFIAPGASWPSPSVIESRDGEFGAGMPTKFTSPITPIHFVPNRVRVDDHADTLPVVGPQQNRVADNRVARTTPDNH